MPGNVPGRAPRTAAPAARPDYRIEDLAHASGTTVRTIRAYQDRGLLPKPERRGRANVYGAEHLARLRQIGELLERGYTLASIKELLEAWDAGTGLGGVLGLVSEVDRPWSDERPARIGRADLIARFGGVADDGAIAEAVELGVLEPVTEPGAEEGGAAADAAEFLVPSPLELAAAAELYAAGVPLSAISGHLRELRGQVEHIAERFLEFTTEHVFHRYLDHPPTEDEATEAAGLVRRLRPLAQQTMDAELARAMRTLATRMVQRHLGDLPLPAALAGPATVTGPATVAGPGARDAGPPWASGVPDTVPVALPAGTVRSVRALVGARNTAAFIAAAAEREVRARTMDDLAAAGRRPRPHHEDDEGARS
ncbi:MerR family transcriptional regulator [Streptantibioticus cattleyicolor]|uniref:MerR family transcriptional regulator n=1 Tax=Streptomyces sp. SID5468 TaxID=2690295 RepID=UPI001564D9B3|nr:MerR family transcriptional regulator [Streptantibioticus cattleyicolor]